MIFKLIMNDNNKDFIKTIDSFWENDVWVSDLNYIIDQKIIQVIKNINDLKKKNLVVLFLI